MAERDRVLGYVDEGGCQITAGYVGQRPGRPWHDGRVVRVFTEDKAAQFVPES